MADNDVKRQDNKDAESGEPVQLDKEQQGGQDHEDAGEQGGAEEMAEQAAE